METRGGPRKRGLGYLGMKARPFCVLPPLDLVHFQPLLRRGQCFSIIPFLFNPVAVVWYT